MARQIIFGLTVLFVMFLSGCATQGTHIGRPEPAKQAKKSVYSFKLGNGVNVVVKEGKPGGPTAVQLWVADGSASEPSGKHGISHLVEHMLFCGSKSLPAGRAAEVIEGMGGEFNGDTGKDFCYLGATLPGKGWDKAVDVLFDMAAFPTFPDDQIKKQKEVIALEDADRARDADTRLMDLFFGTSYEVHPYRFPITGDRASLGSFTRDEAVAYHDSVYRPSNMTLVVVGDASPQAVKSLADRTFGTLAEPPEEKKADVTEPNQISVREKYADMPVELAYMAGGWHVCSASGPDIYALDVMKAILGTGEGSRLSTELKQGRELLLDVNTELFALKDPGMFVIKAKLYDGDLTRAREEILRQAQKLKDGTVSQQELDRAVNCIEAARMLNMDKVEGQAYSFGFWTTVYRGTGPGEYIENIKKVTPLDIRRVAQTYLGEGNYTIAVIRPQSHE